MATNENYTNGLPTVDPFYPDGYVSTDQDRQQIIAQKEKYAALFREYFLKTFSSRLAEYSNPEIQVNSKEKIIEALKRL